MKKTARKIYCLVLFFYLAFPLPSAYADAEGNSPFIIHATGNYHLEARDLVGYADGFDILAGVDFLIWDEAGLYAGPRLGWYAETVCTAYMASELAMYQKPSVGAQVYFIYPAPFLKQLQGTAGFAFDVLLNLDELHSDPGERLYLFTSAFLGVRFIFWESFHLEARLEAGAFPFFRDPPIFIKGGLQAGIHL
jgi:hypothetical protein